MTGRKKMNQSAKVTFLSEAPTLKWVQEHVEGYVEQVRMPDGRRMLVNEDGRMMGLGVNADASALAGQTIVGNAVVLADGVEF